MGHKSHVFYYQIAPWNEGASHFDFEEENRIGSIGVKNVHKRTPILKKDIYEYNQLLFCLKEWPP